MKKLCVFIVVLLLAITTISCDKDECPVCHECECTCAAGCTQCDPGECICPK